MACLGDMQCRADDFFVTEIGREGLQLGLQEAGDFWQLPSPISQPENGAGLAAALGPIFEAAGCDDGCSFLRAATWFASWNGGAARDGLEEAPDARYDSLDLVMPWFEAMPLPASDASASMVTDLVGEAAHDPAAARLRSLLEQKLADWQAQVAAGGVDEQLADYVARWDEYLAQ